MTDLIIGIGKLFTWSFKILPIIGHFADWIFVVILCLVLLYWMKRIVDFGQKDKEYDGDRI
ncbi:hypothetical protein ETU08_05750 [Apibacter muscae]|uniref:Uncharacterized protein n=1 Tax=Apibacter muscae TaxID=2509004 RepID=A0A563DF37_9FLAO|nr:hypothetical protein [Apibacter muscae]TWP24376.1 hypothetical protein ETU10_03800 [Apibacter muscae]TWP28689.1 hypothetical protein ETU09_05060 [Apibacter muscae]TWP30062.1 hypothetical protein ETU08_05750 [Apibacter muscae]